MALTYDDVLDRLSLAYGEPEWRPHHDAVSELVLTLLSQNTSDTNSGRAFSRLLQRYPTWQDVVDAPVSEVEDAIRPGGLAPTKAPRLQALLNEVKARRGGFDLSFLEDVPIEQAREWLQTLPGVGPKTAACVLLFGMGRPGLPVDTHVHRVAGRLGLIPPKAPPDKAQTQLEAEVPPEDHYRFHILLLRHGRHRCPARSPICSECPLQPECPYAQGLLTPAVEPAAGEVTSSKAPARRKRKS